MELAVKPKAGCRFDLVDTDLVDVARIRAGDARAVTDKARRYVAAVAQARALQPS